MTPRRKKDGRPLQLSCMVSRPCDCAVSCDCYNYDSSAYQRSQGHSGV